MRFPKLLKPLALALLIAAPAFAQEETPPSPIAQTQLVLHAPQVVNGKPIPAGVLFTLPDEWHIYWQNPGDSGIPTTLEWTLPEGMTASAIDWPVPQRVETSGIYNYGYSNQVLLPVTLTPGRDGISGDITVKADWLVCKEICIPESATLTATLPVESPQAQVLLTNHASDTPRILKGTAHYSATPETVTLSLDGIQDLGDTHAGGFFPIEDGVVTNASTQDVLFGGNGDTITLQFARGGSELPPVWHGVFITNNGKAFNIAAEYRAAAPAQAETPNLVWLLGLALLGGLLLNLMPCVLPILSLKALALAKKSGAEQRAARVQGVSYTFGVVATFLAIAGAMLLLKAGGAAIGWGFQLQEPAVIAALFFLMLLVALNLFGWFELPVLFGNSFGNTHSSRGAFLTGALAVALATPCTAPFMATAIGATLTLPPVQSLAVFAAIGLGMAAPFLVISLWPAARAWLPKPGHWMLRFKQFLAFPMFATAAWLLWVLVQINGPMGLAIALTGAVLMAFLLWLGHGASQGRRSLLWLATVLAVVWAIASQPQPQADMPEDRSEPFSEARLQELRDAGRPVFVDATAAWCITCKINERVALQDSSVQALFTEHDIALLVADWTTRNEAITRYLASFGRNGVPLYVYYAPNSEPKVLPQLLTPATVRNTLQPK